MALPDGPGSFLIAADVVGARGAIESGSASKPHICRVIANWDGKQILGDIRGQYYDLLRLFERGGFPPASNYLFLGNYVDGGKQSLETICLCLAYKIKYPEKFFMLRGIHETAAMNRVCGFYDECKRRYSIGLWKSFINVMNCMPIAAIIDEDIMCMSGGLSPDLISMIQIRHILRPTDVSLTFRPNVLSGFGGCAAQISRLGTFPPTDISLANVTGP
ncbi:MAG: hypothetical protein L6R42_004933 [Xanthoria sp. 1 TBL-2021]|nr:MAG: hypothetical protein L6R42_004933 [Xanthoria sp. 1 TBL-2021]